MILNRKTIKYTGISISMLLFAATALGFGTPKHSKVDVTLDKSKAVFKVVPNEGLQLTFDAPWSFKIKNSNNIAFEKTKLGKDSLKTDDGSYTIKIESRQTPWSAQYELISFVCTKDKTKCYREVHKGELNPKKKPKTTI